MYFNCQISELLPSGFHLASTVCLTVVINADFVPYHFCAEWLVLIRATFICTIGRDCSEKKYFMLELGMLDATIIAK